MTEFLRKKSLAVDPSLLEDAVRLNRALIKLPFQEKDVEATTSFNIWDFYRSVLTGTPTSLLHRPFVNHIHRASAVFHSWEEWYREVVWYGNKKGAYLYGNQPAECELEGHF